MGQSRRKICRSLCDKQWATGTLRASSVRRFFTIPKILRHSFKFDKRLFGEVSKLIFSLLSEFFSLAAGQELLCACVISYQSFGEFARFHPHWHVMALEGGFTRSANRRRRRHAQGLASHYAGTVSAKEANRPDPCEHTQGFQAFGLQYRERNKAAQYS